MHPHAAVELAYTERDRIADLDLDGVEELAGWTVQLDRRSVASG